MEWFDIRDMLFGLNYKKQDICKALELAKVCKHPDALYVLDIFKDLKDCTEDGIIFILRIRKENMSNLYLNLISYSYTVAFGNFVYFEHPLAMTYYGRQVHDKKMIEKAAALGERDAFFFLKDFKMGMKLGCIESYLSYAETCSDIIEVIKIRAYIAKNTKIGWYFFVRKIRTWLLLENDAVNYQIGKELHDFDLFQYFIRSVANEIDHYCVAFYHNRNREYRKAVDAFSICMIRMKLIKDMRIYIAKFIWEGRNEFN